MAINGLDFKNQYAMFGSASTATNNGGMNVPKGGDEPIDFGKKSIEGIGGQAEAGKVSGTGQHAGSNLGFVQRLDKIDEANILDRPESKSCVDGFSSGLADKLDLWA